MNWIEYKVKHWYDFVSFIDSMTKRKGRINNWFFRGQSNASWTLTPSLLRLFNSGVISIQDTIEIEIKICKKFQAQYHLHSQNSMLSIEWGYPSWWTIMQHFSCPTRLLDWTASPFVAVYFAVDQNLEEDGAVWMFETFQLEKEVIRRQGNFKDLKDENWVSGEPLAIYSVEPNFHNERSAMQQGVFTVCTNILKDHGDAISEALTDIKEQFETYKIVIPRDQKNEFLTRLSEMNITPSALFPGLDGIGKSLKDYARINVWQIDQRQKLS